MALLVGGPIDVATYYLGTSKLRHNFGLHDDTRYTAILR